MRYGSVAIRVKVRFDPELVGEAICWNGSNVLEVREFLGYIDRDDNGRLVILSPDGVKKIIEGDWIVRLDAAMDMVAPVNSGMFDIMFVGA